jgi:hypothetical protein
MGTFTRVNGLRNTVATLYMDNCNMFVIQVQNAANSNRDLRDEDDAVDEAVEYIVNFNNGTNLCHRQIKKCLFLKLILCSRNLKINFDYILYVVLLQNHL